MNDATIVKKKLKYFAKIRIHVKKLTTQQLYKNMQMEFDFWTKNDVATAMKWSKAEECRIPNKRVARGGRLHKWEQTKDKKRDREREKRG